MGICVHSLLYIHICIYVIRIAKKLNTNNMFFSIPFSAVYSDHGKQQILYILEKISALKPHERLLLYLRMPNGSTETGK